MTKAMKSRIVCSRGMTAAWALLAAANFIGIFEPANTSWWLNLIALVFAIVAFLFALLEDVKED